jgi:BCD family chlorophyll transporter-like MFS transporter
MILLPVLHRLIPAWRRRTTPWIVSGCIVCAVGLFNMAAAAAVGPGYPLRASFVLLGLTSGIFSIAAIGAMMNLVGAGHKNREGTRMGLWGASQAISYAVGGFLGTLASDAARHVLPSISTSYALVFAAEAGLFVFAACLAIWIGKPVIISHPVEETAWDAAKQEA